MNFRPEIFSDFVIDQWNLTKNTKCLAMYACHLKTKYSNSEKTFVELLSSYFDSSQLISNFKEELDNLYIQNSMIIAAAVPEVIKKKTIKYANDYKSWIHPNSINQQLLVHVGPDEYKVIDAEKLLTTNYSVIEKMFSVINGKVRPFFCPITFRKMSIKHEKRKGLSFAFYRIGYHPNSKYAGSKPVSPLHQEMIVRMWKLLQKLGFKNIRCNHKHVPVPGGTYRVPDSEACFDDRKFYLEVQVSDIDAVRISGKNYDYKILDCSPIWVVSKKFRDQIIKGNPSASASYLFVYNKLNVFCMNDDMSELHVVYQVPYVRNGIIYTKIQRDTVTDWNEQIFLIDNIPCFFDYDSTLEQCRKTIEKENMFKYFRRKYLKTSSSCKESHFSAFVAERELLTTKFIFSLRKLYQYYMDNNRYKLAQNIIDAMRYFYLQKRRFWLGRLLLWIYNFKEILHINYSYFKDIVFDVRDYDYNSFFCKI